MKANRELAERLRALHQGPRALVLCNVWDAAGACLVEQLGYPAVATTSAGIAVSLGYPDGQRIPMRLMVETVGRICAATRLPVTADFEAGYAAEPDAIAANVIEVLRAGAVGINLEDTSRGKLRPVEAQVAILRRVREAAAAAGMALVINARTDACDGGIAVEGDRLEEAVRRGRAYREAGADCIFVPFLRELPAIAKVCAALPAPVNVLAVPGMASVAELERAGARRISVGSGPARAALSALRRVAEELRAGGTYESLGGAISYADANRLVEQRPSS